MVLSYSKKERFIIVYSVCQAVTATQSRRLVVKLIGSVNTGSALMSSLKRRFLNFFPFFFFYKRMKTPIYWQISPMEMSKLCMSYTI